MRYLYFLFIFSCVNLIACPIGNCNDQQKLKQEGRKQRKNIEIPKPTFENVSYDKYKRTKLSFWQSKSKTPTPVLVYIHGGAFKMGNLNMVKQLNKDGIFQNLLNNGVSIASVGYRFLHGKSA